MLLDVRYRYTAKIIPFQKRNEIERDYLDTVTVKVREVSDVEAPVAFRFLDAERMPWEQGAGTPDAALVDVRVVDDALFEPYARQIGSRDDWVRLDASFLTQAAATDVETEAGYTANLFGTATKRYNSRDTDPGDFPKARHLSDDRRARTDAIHGKADALLLIDGALYRRTTEPVYSIRGHHLSIKRLATISGETISHASTYRADEAELIPEAYRRDGLDPIEVLEPQAITYRGPALALFESASSVLSGLKSGLADASVESFSRYAALRDAIRTAEALGVTAEDSTVETILPLLEQILAKDLGKDHWSASRIEAIAARLDAMALRSLDDCGFRP